MTEAVWLRPDPPDAAVRNWQGYPAMADLGGCRARISEAGLGLVGDFVLDEAAWWDDYYTPMAQRIEGLAERYRGDPVAERVLEACRAVIATYRDHADCYGYAFFVVRR